MKIGHGNDAQHVVLDLQYYSVGKTAHAGDEFYLAALDFTNASFGLVGPEAIDVRLGRQVQACEKPFNEGDSRLGWQRQRFVESCIFYLIP